MNSSWVEWHKAMVYWVNPGELRGLCVSMSAPVRTWADGRERTKGSIIAYFENNVHLSQAELRLDLS